MSDLDVELSKVPRVVGESVSVWLCFVAAILASGKEVVNRYGDLSGIAGIELEHCEGGLHVEVVGRSRVDRGAAKPSTGGSSRHILLRR